MTKMNDETIKLCELLRLVEECTQVTSECIVCGYGDTVTRARELHLAALDLYIETVKASGS